MQELELQQISDSFYRRVDRRGDDECWNWLGQVKIGREYGVFNHGSKHIRAAKIALLLDGIDVPSGMAVCCLCNNRRCVNPNHMSIESWAGVDRKPLDVRFWERVDVRGEDECWPWVGSVVERGYGVLFIQGEDSVLAHRYSWTIHNGLIPDGLFVCHHCDNPPCVNPQHLFLGTNLDNIQDMVRKGRHTIGERNARAKLTSDQVLRVRELYSSGKYTQEELADMFKVCVSNVYQIVTGKIWKHLLVHP